MPVLYVKPSGKEIEINENAIDYAESLGWKKKETPKPKPKQKKKPKSED